MDIIIDSKIRDWVFLPLIFVMFMVGIFRYYLNQYNTFNTIPIKTKSKKALDDANDQQLIKKCKSIQQHHGIISLHSFNIRKSFYCKKDTGILFKYKDIQVQPDPMQGLAQNQGMMGDMLKNNLSMAVATMLQFGWVSYFFSGFILAKVPFPLTQQFRTMLQQGVKIQTLDVHYVSSLSLYFMVLFGLSGLQSLILGDADDEFLRMNDMNRMQMQQMNGMMGQQQQPDIQKVFNSERENLELISHQFTIENSEELLIKKLRYLKKSKQ